MRCQSERFSLPHRLVFRRLSSGFELWCGRHPIGECHRTRCIELFFQRSLQFLLFAFFILLLLVRLLFRHCFQIRKVFPRFPRPRVLLKVARVLLHFLGLFRQLLKVGIVHRIVLHPKERDEENATDNENGKESRLSEHWKRNARLPGILQIQTNDRRRSGVAAKCFRVGR